MADRALAQHQDATHPIAPIVRNRPAKALGRTLKIVAFNAKGGARFEGTLACLKRRPLADADVILFCEADWNNRRSSWRKFAAEIADSLNMSFAYHGEYGKPNQVGEPIAFRGNAILCSQPLEAAHAIPVPNGWVSRRFRRMLGGPAGLVVRIHVRGKGINIGVVHLNSRWDPAGRDGQMREYLSCLPAGPSIIGGDFNTTTVELYPRTVFLKSMLRLLVEPRRLSDPTKWETLFTRMEEAGFRIDGANAPGKRTFTYSRMVPPFMRPNLDWIALRGLEPVIGSAAAVPARPSFFSGRISDHDFVMCEVKI
jgi:endonuclease/exonuclease/phosphatase family metal-dependent hydrolase